MQTDLFGTNQNQKQRKIETSGVKLSGCFTTSCRADICDDNSSNYSRYYPNQVSPATTQEQGPGYRSDLLHPTPQTLLHPFPGFNLERFDSIISFKYSAQLATSNTSNNHTLHYNYKTHLTTPKQQYFTTETNNYYHHTSLLIITSPTSIIILK